MSRLFPCPKRQNASAPVVWPLTAVALALVLVVLNGRSLTAQANPQTLVMLPFILEGGNQQPTYPVARDDSYETAEDTVLIVNAANGILANDVDPERDWLRAVLVETAAHGRLYLSEDGSFDYTPERGFRGQDSFTYRASDGTAVSNLATVTLTVSAANSAPSATNDGYEMAANTTLTVTAANGVLANDVDAEQDALQAMLVETTAHGVLNLRADGSFDYTPDRDFSGQDSFTYRASDGVSVSNPATVTVRVTAGNVAPTAADDTYQAFRDTSFAVQAASGVLANDTDPNADALQAMLLNGVAHGVLNFNADGSFTYAPDSGFTGEDSFTYRASDGTAVSDVATVTLSVAVNEAPQIVTGRIAFTKQIIGTGVDEAHSVGAADFDGDGDLDVVATDYVDGLVLWYENQGNGAFVEKVLDGNLAGAYPSHVADVDEDGAVDVLAGGYLADTFAWYRNEGDGRFARRNIDTAANGAHSIVTSDLDGDGDVDFVTASQDGNTVAWYENDGANRFTRHVIDAAALQAKRAEVADLDGDGDLDVVSASFTSRDVSWRGVIAWHENDGAQNFTKHVIDDAAKGAYYVAPADIDGDGDLDVFSANRRANTVAWYRNDGAGNFTARVVDDNAAGVRTVLPVDLDGDGDVDALAASVDDDTIAWHENDGRGNFTKRPIDRAADGAYGLFFIDMDFDGDLDVLSATRDAGTVALHTHIRAHTVTIAPGATLLIDATRLRTVDAHSGPAALTYTLTAVPALGELRLDGVPLSAGDRFTQAAVNDGRLTYVPGGGPASSDKFSFTVADGGENGVRPATGTFTIRISGAN